MDKKDIVEDFDGRILSLKSEIMLRRDRNEALQIINQDVFEDEETIIRVNNKHYLKRDLYWLEVMPRSNRNDVLRCKFIHKLCKSLWSSLPFHLTTARW